MEVYFDNYSFIYMYQTRFDYYIRELINGTQEDIILTFYANSKEHAEYLFKNSNHFKNNDRVLIKILHIHEYPNSEYYKNKNIKKFKQLKLF